MPMCRMAVQAGLIARNFSRPAARRKGLHPHLPPYSRVREKCAAHPLPQRDQGRLPSAHATLLTADAHAEPGETAISCVIQQHGDIFAFNCGEGKICRCPEDGASAPFSRVCGIFKIPPSTVCRSPVRRRASLSSSASASSSARASLRCRRRIPYRPGSHVPARRGHQRRTSRYHLADINGAGTLWPPNLCADSVRITILHALTGERDMTSACTASVWNGIPRSCAIAPISRIG